MKPGTAEPGSICSAAGPEKTEVSGYTGDFRFQICFRYGYAAS